MDERNWNRSGKTFKRLPHHFIEDSLLKIDGNETSRETIELSGTTFSKNVCYSMKKKNRWMLSGLLSKDIYDEDIPIVFSRHQAMTDQKHIKTIFMFDSMLDAEFGSRRISNNRLNPVGFNGESRIKTTEMKFQRSKRELRQFEKSKCYGSIKLKKSRKEHRPILKYVPERHEKCPPTAAQLLHLEARSTVVFVNEYVNVSNVSHVNVIHPLRDSDRPVHQDSRKYPTKYDPCDLYDVYSEEEEEQEQQFNVEDTARPFMLQDSDFVVSCRPPKPKKCKRFRRNNPHKTHPECLKDTAKCPPNEIPVCQEDKSSFIVDLSRDVMPFIVTELPYESFVEDLSQLVRSHQCWVSDTSPRLVLVGLDESGDVAAKNYVVLTPTIGMCEEVVTLKMSFNTTQFDFNEALNHEFTDLGEFVQFIQTKLTATKEISSSTKTQILELDYKIEETYNVWQTKKSESPKDIFQLHNEWINHMFTDNDIGTIVSCLKDGGKYTIDSCQVCLSEFADEELIMIHNCNHKICEECLCSHLILRLETGMQHLNCPGTQCQTQLDCALILSLVSHRRYCMRLRNLETNVLQKTGTSCFNCRAVTVTNNIDSETSRPRFNYICSCKHVICNVCGHDQHWPSSCNENRRHLQKLKELNDMELFSKRIEPLIIKGNNCPKCFVFITKSKGCNSMICICGTEFCWACGDLRKKGNHEISFPCENEKFNHLKTIDFSLSLPDSCNLRPRLYILSLNQRINNLRCYIFRVFNSIDTKRLFNSNMTSSQPIYDIKSFKNQIVQLNRVTEYLFVKAYQVPESKHAHLQLYLKKSAFMLIYFQNQINYHAETISYLMKISRNGTGSIKKARDHYIKLTDVMSYVNKYICRIHSVLNN